MTYVVALVVLYNSLGVYIGLISPPFAWQSPLLSVVVRALASSEASLAYNFILAHTSSTCKSFNAHVYGQSPPKFSRPTQANFLTVERTVQTDRQTEISSLYRLHGARSGSPQLYHQSHPVPCKYSASLSS